MKVVFLSSYLNHHQLPICLELFKQTEGSFVFISTMETPNFRKKLGYEEMNEKYDFVYCTYKEKNSTAYIRDLCRDCDILIVGSADEEYYQDRLNYKKLTFKYSERLFKTDEEEKDILKNKIKNLVCAKKNNHYLLCASAYAREDYNRIGLFKNKCFRWGYFPETFNYDIEDILNKKNNEQLNILWVGRLIKYKHPEILIECAQYLIDNNFNRFKITIIGDGELTHQLTDEINNNDLCRYFDVAGSIPSNEVRKYMLESNIFLFTSDKQEGWGAVLNESMNSGCAVIANNEIGATPYLIKNCENGIIYKNKEELFSKLLTLVKDKNLQKILGRNAYFTIVNEWNARNAVLKFLKLSEYLLNNPNQKSVDLFYDGVCSMDY